MQIKAHELERHLSQTLAHIYVLSGDEPLQLEEALDYLRETARKKGFNEKIRFDIGPKFEWQALEQEIQSMSLFSEKRIGTWGDCFCPGGCSGPFGGKSSESAVSTCSAYFE